MKANAVIVLIVYFSAVGLIYHLAERSCKVDAVYAVVIAVLKFIALL